MKMLMHKCKICGEYTLKDSCQYCEGEITIVYPPKYSVGDKYGKYRRILKKEAEANSVN